MNYRIADLRNKEVINVKNGERIGFISDLEVDTQSARISAVIVYGRQRLFGLLGREADFVIPWKNISLFGHDAVLVQYEAPKKTEEKSVKNFFEKLFA